MITAMGNLENDSRIQQFWDDYARAARVNVHARFRVLAFGDTTELANERAALVLAGKKRAITRLVRDFLTVFQPVPKRGDFSVVVGGDKTPRCIVRTLEVQTKQIRDVDKNYAWDEGEGDRSLKWWKSAHTRYFTRQAAREGFSIGDHTEVILERFEVVWPPEFSDRHNKKLRR